MSKGGGKNHSHKLKRVNLSKKGEYYVYKCFRPGCTTYYPMTTVVSVSALCWQCNKDFTFSGRNLEQVKAKCASCSSKGDEKAERLTAAEDILKKLGVH